MLWVHQFGTVESTNAFGVACDGEGNVYLTGDTGGELGDANQGEFDAWVAKYNPAGDVLWLQQFGTAGFDSAHDVAIDAERESVYLTGSTYDPGAGR